MTLLFFLATVSQSVSLVSPQNPLFIALVTDDVGATSFELKMNLIIGFYDVKKHVLLTVSSRCTDDIENGGNLVDSDSRLASEWYTRREGGS